ncbi:MAG: type VI secretion system contractile sheath large subunit, partial [Bryobacteraceae bacterium]
MPERFSRSSVQLDVAPGEHEAPVELDPEAPFRILILGDFSGRAGRGLHTGLSGRRPVLVDRDNIDEVLGGMHAALNLPGMALQFRELDDFHPDTIYRRVDVFQQLQASPPAPPAVEAPAPPSPARGLSLDDMIDATLEKRPSVPPELEEDLSDFLKRVVSPHLEQSKDPRELQQAAQSQYKAGAVMRAVLHHGRFQALEAAWRAVYMLVRGLDTGARLKIFLFDATREEITADLSGLEALLTGQREPWAVVAGNYSFEQSEEDAADLSLLGKLAQAAGAPFLAEASPSEGEPEAQWQALRRSPEASWIGLALPRFLLRMPYGKDTSAIDEFEFEEMPESVHEHYLWGNPAFACAFLLGQAYQSYGWQMRPGVHRQIDDLPVHIYREDGESIMKPCGEMLLSEREAEYLLDQGIMPLASFKDRGSVLIYRFQSIADPAAPLSGR